MAVSWTYRRVMRASVRRPGRQVGRWIDSRTARPDKIVASSFPDRPLVPAPSSPASAVPACPPSSMAAADRNLDVAIVGFGFSGIYESHLLHNVQGLKTMAFEVSDEPGGTWNWNRYPGARVDIASRDYSFKFDPELYNEWNWKELYAPQAELMDYVRHLVQRYKLESQVQYRSFVPGATWDEGSSRWTVEVKHRPADGEEEVQHWTAQHLVLATGCLSAPNLPKFPGMEDYKGELYHTARWPKDGVDFAGKTVAVIGTGSSAVQSIPVIAEKAKDLTVFQRTATYTIPAWNRTLTQEELEAAKLDSQELRKIGLTHPLGNATFAFTEKSWGEYTPEEREARLEHIWNLGGLNFYGSFADLLLNKESSDGARDFLHRKIKSIVKDQKTAELLCPVHPPGCKRICADTDYYKTYNKPNVHLVSVKDNAIKVVGGKDGKIVLEDGTAYGPFDVIVSATGFDAMTGTLMKLNIVGKDGLTLQKAWEAGPVNYLGLFIAGFPNMYHIAGPGSPSVLTNMIVSIEQHVEWIADCIKKMREQGYKTVEATEKAQADWVGHVNAVADATLLKNCTSWYLGANIPGKPQVFMPLLGLPDYVVKCNEVLATFDGLKLTK